MSYSVYEIRLKFAKHIENIKIRKCSDRRPHEIRNEVAADAQNEIRNADYDISPERRVLSS